MSDEIQFPQTPWDRLKDRLRHWWHARRVKLPEAPPEDWDSPLCVVVLDLLDD